MKVRFVSGMDMLNLSRAFANIISGAASVSPVYTTILESDIIVFGLIMTLCQTWLQDSVSEQHELHTIELVPLHHQHCSMGGKRLQTHIHFLGQP